MPTVNFTTSKSTGKYFVHDTSIDVSACQFKVVRIKDYGQNVIFDSGNIDINENTIEVDTTSWTDLSTIVEIFVELSYPAPVSSSLTKGFYLPTLFNIPAQ